MKHYFNITLCTIIMIFMIDCLHARTKDYFVENFENSTPIGWTQENIAGKERWTIESGDGLDYPNGAFEGYKRISLRNYTNMTQRFCTRLITPIINVSKAKKGIVLTYAHAQAQWTGDFDTLKVFYRTAPDKEWIMLKEFKQQINEWSTDTITIPEISETLQISFTGTDNLGRGIVLDAVRVKPMEGVIKERKQAAKMAEKEAIKAARIQAKAARQAANETVKAAHMQTKAAKQAAKEAVKTAR